MIKYLYSSGKEQKIEKLQKPRSGAWIFVYDITPEEVEKLISLGFDETIIEDATDYFEVPRFETIDGIQYLLTRYAVDAGGGDVPTAPILIALSDNYILTISHRKAEFLDDFVHGRRDIITTKHIDALLLMLDTIIKEYDKHLISIRRLLAKYLGNIKNVTENDLQRIVSLESQLLDYTNSLISTADALNVMLRSRRDLTLDQEDTEVLEDLTQDINQIISSVEYVSKAVQSVRSTHEALIGHKLNATMKTLTAFTIILTVPTIISGIFGMNTWLPFTTGPISFVIVMTIITIVAYVVMRWFAKNGWL